MRIPIALAAILAAALTAAPAAGASGPESVELIRSPAQATIRLGETIDLEVTVTNTSDGPTEELAIHIDVTDPGSRSSVDPEDWTSTLTRFVGPIDPGATVTARWEIQPISGGTFTVYAVALAAGSRNLTASGATLITVDEQRSLNPEGVPVALAAPLLVGGLFLAQQWSARRSARTSA